MFSLGKSSAAAALALSLSLGAMAVPDRAQAGIEPYLGDVMIVGFGFCPRGWAEAAGQLLPISQNQALFSLLGTQFGGNGQTTFALPDLRGRLTLGQGTGPGLSPHVAGEAAGSQTATMTLATMPSHTHAVNANNQDGDRPGPAGRLLAAAPTGGTGNETIYSQASPNVTMNPAMIGMSGSSVPFAIQDPSLVLIHCIALQGLFPPRD